MLSAVELCTNMAAVHAHLKYKQVDAQLAHKITRAPAAKTFCTLFAKSITCFCCASAVFVSFFRKIVQVMFIE